jgi:hypothetical protein
MSFRSLCAVLAALALPGLAGAAEEPPPCRPGKPRDVELVSAWPVGTANLRGRAGGSVKVRVTNRSGRVVCRLFGELTLNGKVRPVTCSEPAVGVGAETEMVCEFALMPGERQGGGLDLRTRRRPGTPAPRESARPHVRIKLRGLELADAAAWREWGARQEAERRRAAARAAAVRAGFRHTLTLKRATNDKEARVLLERALGRLKECLVARAKRNPKLVVELQLRLGVSRAGGGDAPPESLLAVTVVAAKGPKAEIRDCSEALELTTIPAGLDFEAVAAVTYAAASR